MPGLSPRNPPLTPGTPDEIVAQIAARQHGVIRLAQLLWAGLSPKAITRRVKSGRLHRLFRGVYAVGHAGLSGKGRMLAAVYACGDDAAIGHFHAAKLWDATRFPLPALIDVIVPKQRVAREGFRVHESATLRRGDVTRIDGIPVTRVARMLVDLAEVLTAHQLAHMIYKAAFRDLFDLEATRDAIRRANGRRLKNLERAIELHLSGSAGTRSKGEDTFLAQLEGHLDEPLVNTHLLNEEVDFHWPDRRLIVEVDGRQHELAPTQRNDVRRDAKLTAAGYTVVRFKSQQIYDGSALYATLGSSCGARGATRPAAA